MGNIWSYYFAPQEDTTQGHHEVGILGTGPEGVECEYQWKNCTKNKGHFGFVPVNKFFMRNLPTGFQNWDCHEKFKIVAFLTVRLRVCATSLDRPEEVDNPISQLRGTRATRTGSGFITGIREGQGACPCGACDRSATQRHWFIYVRTVNHVVFNTEEASRTKIDLFFDEDDSDQDGRMTTLTGLDVVTTDPTDDYCTVRCVLHDEHLALQIQAQTSSLGKIDKFRPHWTRVNWSKFFALIISHPHGQPKMVTIGEIKWAAVKNPKGITTPDTTSECSYEYDTPTCLGSSGAPVVILRYREKEPPIAFMEMNGFVHGGTRITFDVAVNYSSTSSPYITITPGGIEPSKAPYRMVHLVKTKNYDSCTVQNKDDSPMYVPY